MKLSYILSTFTFTVGNERKFHQSNGVQEYMEYHGFTAYGVTVECLYRATMEYI